MTHQGPTPDERSGPDDETPVGGPAPTEQIDEQGTSMPLSETLKQAVEEIGDEWERMRSTIGPFQVGNSTD